MVSRDKRSSSKKSAAQLMFNTHDALGEMHGTERAQEDDYFRKLDHELLVALRANSHAEAEQVIQQYTHGRCPRCGKLLEDMPCHGAMLAGCPRCGGVWLDKGQWEGRVGPKAQGWLQQIFDGLIGSSRARL